jgi:uncharacterized protein (DUF4415 family)
MKARAPLTDEEGEVREITAADLKHFRATDQVLPPSLAARLNSGRRGRQKAPQKERVTVRVSRDVVERFRAFGEGWESRLDAALRDWLETHSSN